MTTCSDLPSETMLWIKLVEMVDSLDELKSSRSVGGTNFPNFEVRCENRFCFESDHPEFPLQETGQFQGTEAQQKGRFLRGRQIALMICDYFRVTGAHDSVQDYADLFSVTLRDDNVQEFDTRWDEVQLSMSKIPSDDVLESLFNLRRESAQVKTVFRIVRHGDSSEDIDAQLSEIENNCEKEERSQTPITKLRRQARENRNRSRGQESKGIKWR